MAFTQLEPSSINTSAAFTFASVSTAGPTNLGPISNVIITGGSSGQVMQTDGAGNLTWATVSGGSGGTATTIAGANVTGTVANAAYAITSGTSYAVSGSNVTGQVGNALVAGTVYTNAQPNITSVGTLTSLAITGNITSGNATLGNLVTANFHSGSGNLLSNIQGANVSGAVGLATFATTANAVAGSNVSGAVSFATTANAVAGANVSGQVANALVAGTVYTNAQPNITSVGTLSSVTVSGATTLGNLSVSNITSNVSLLNWTTLQQSTDVMTSPTFANPLSVSLNTGAVIYVTPSSNFTLNITGVPTTVNRIIQVNVILNQGSTGYFCNTIQIDGVSQTLRWASGTAPTPGANKIEVQSLSLIRTGAGAWVVLGDYGTYA